MHVQGILAAKGSAVATVERRASVGHAVELLRSHGIGALVVSSDGSTIDGILSERDVVRHLAERGADTMAASVDDLMTSEVHTCRPGDTVQQLMALMTAQRVRHVPVVGDDGRLVGIVSIGDVVKHRLGELEGENRALFEYITHGR